MALSRRSLAGGGGGDHQRSAWPRVSWIALTSSILSALSLLAIFLSYTTSQPVYTENSLPQDARGGSAGACRMSYMSPSYFRLDFGREYSRLGGGPWGLYLYREAGWDPDPIVTDAHSDKPIHLTGTPVLFVPGNAGSFRQVRSLASAATRTWFDVPGVRRKGAGPKHTGARQLDFFTLDFNDDFSAFHGQTLLDQAEYVADSIRYILSLYHYSVDSGLPDPTSVILVAHSMGGLVARAAFLHPHFQQHSISTLITFATPHTVPPATVDRGVDVVYDRVNRYWRSAFGLGSTPVDPAAAEALKSLVVVSVGGGLSDLMIASESASLASLQPVNNSYGFTVFTTAISSVGTSVDHLAILWCQQLMYTVSNAILSIVDVRQSQGVDARPERVEKLAEFLLDHLDAPATALVSRSGGSAVTRGKKTLLRTGERLSLKHGTEGGQRTVFVMPVPPSASYSSARVFSLLTDAAIGRAPHALVEVYACSLSAEALAASPETPDEDDSPNLGENCIPLFPTHTSLLPASPHEGFAPDGPPLSFVSVEVAQLEAGDNLRHIVVVVKPGLTWVVAEFGDLEKRVHVVEKSPLQLLFGGYRLEAMPPVPMLVSEVWIPALDTSLLTFKLQVFRGECHGSKSLFSPLIRQSSPLIHETKYFPNARVASLFTLATGPFQSRSLSPFSGSGTRLQAFLDPNCPSSDLAIEITVDVWGTLGALVMRYRMAAVAFPFSLVMFVFAIQLKDYNNGQHFMPFGRGLSRFVRQAFAPLLASLTAISLLQSLALGTHRDLPSLPPLWISNALLGNESAFFVFLIGFLVFACLGAVVLEYLVLQTLVGAVAGLVKVMSTYGPVSMRAAFSASEPRETLPTHRVFSMGALLLFVLFFAPYQFAFLVIFLVHFFSTVRSLLIAQDTSPPSTSASLKRAWDRYHYSFSVLLVMMTLLPITALILVVWVRNLAVGWLAPFSSDHNVLNIVGFLLNVEALHSGKLIQRSRHRLTSSVTVVLPTAFGLYGIFYGVRYTHSIYPLANAFFLWLAANNSEALVGAAYEVVVGKRRRSTLSGAPADPAFGALQVNGNSGRNSVAVNTALVKNGSTSPAPGSPSSTASSSSSSSRRATAFVEDDAEA